MPDVRSEGSPCHVSWSRSRPRSGRQPVRHRGRVGWVGHRADRVIPLLVPLGDTRVLEKVLLPGRDDELLQDPAWLVAVLPHPPGTRPGAAPAEPGIAKCRQEFILV